MPFSVTAQYGELIEVIVTSTLTQAQKKVNELSRDGHYFRPTTTRWVYVAGLKLDLKIEQT